MEQYYYDYKNFVWNYQPVEPIEVYRHYYVSEMPYSEHIREYVHSVRKRAIQTIVVLLTDMELRRHYNKTDLRTLYGYAGFNVLHFPIEDMESPEDFDIFYNYVGRLVSDPNGVLVHCMGGNGRSGTLLTAILIYKGYSPEEALQKVRAARPKAVESHVQWRFLRSFGIYCLFRKNHENK